MRIEHQKVLPLQLGRARTRLAIHGQGSIDLRSRLERQLRKHQFAVGPFAIANGLVDPLHVPRDGICRVRIWQANIGKTIVAHVPITDGQVQESGDFELDGVTFPAAEIVLEFIDPADEGEGEGGGALFPTGNLVDDLEVPGLGTLQATMITAGIPTVFVNARDSVTTAPNCSPRSRRQAALAKLEASVSQLRCAWA